jgi:hypothetical protein
MERAGSRCARVRGTRYDGVHLERDLWSNSLLTQVNGRKRGHRFKSRIDLNANEGDE